MTENVDEEVLQKVRELVAKALALTVDEAGADLSLINDLGAESIDLMALRFFIEDEFDLEIEERELRGATDGENRVALLAAVTPRHIAALVTRKLAERA